MMNVHYNDEFSQQWQILSFKENFPHNEAFQLPWKKTFIAMNDIIILTNSHYKYEFYHNDESSD